MSLHARIVATLIGMMALRKARDYLIKPLGFAAVISIMVHIAEYLVHGRFIMSAVDRIGMATITAFPFMLVVFYVVTYLDRLQLQLGQMAATDALTGLPNRRDFLDRARRRLERQDTGPRGVVLLIDADHFKRINDNWGHAVGDQCLTAIANRMRHELRAGDFLGRIGGEEFAAFLPETPLGDAIKIGERMSQVITVEPANPAGRLRFTLSVGASAVLDGMTLDEAMHRADLALYRAKAEGRARLVVWDGQPRPGEGKVA